MSMNTTLDTLQNSKVEELRTAIGSSLYFGIACLIGCMIFFGVVIQFDFIEDLTPRAANRPKSVIKNAIMHGIPNNTSKHKNQFYYYPIAWINWAYKLTYRDCMFGIPGTGTRKDGWEGPLLKTNLDAVILLRFHALLFKIGLLVAVLCTFIILPVNMTAGCDPEVFGKGTCMIHEHRSHGFLLTTISHIPDKFYNESLDGISDEGPDISTGSILASVLGRPNKDNYTDDLDSDDDGFEEKRSTQLARDWWVTNQTWRVWATMLSCLAIYGYTFYLLTKEWVEVINLRKTFFLEANHYGQRMRELNKLENELFSKRNKSDEANPNRLNDGENSYPRWMTHPEIREVPPSVSTYSVLYQLPKSMVTCGNDGDTQVDRQLEATAKFFDDIVAPQPGYSSSVVAVTVIPANARLVAIAWNKWSACERLIQLIRHIRSLIEEKQRKKCCSPNGSEGEESKKGLEAETNGDDIDVERGDNEGDEPTHPEAVNNSDDDDDEDDGGHNADTELVQSDESAANSLDHDASMKKKESRIDQEPDLVQNPAREQKRARFRYDDFDIAKYAKSLGFIAEVDYMTDFVEGMGVEEFSVFAYMCALMAGGPGLKKKLVNICSIEKLEAEEADAKEALRKAHEELLEARLDVVNVEDDVKLDSDEYNAIITVGSGENIEMEHESVPKFRLSLNDSNKLGLSKHELQAMLPSTEAKTVPTGMVQKVIFHMKRVYFGIDDAAPSLEYYGVEDHSRGNVAYKTDVEHPAYAVVTFTSRHSAVIARQCLADGGATNSWRQIDDIPIYPLADAPAMMCFPRGCMRPVTPTISFTSKKIRRGIICTFLVLFTSFYVWPINKINNLILNEKVIVGRFGISPELYQKYASSLSGLTQALLFSVCPMIFRFVASCEGSASSMQKAEQRALIFFWYFYLIARFMGQILFEAVTKFLQGQTSSVEKVVTSALSDLAKTVPERLGPAALSYVIFISTISWPLLYFLQLNNYLTTIFRLGWINRLLKGGGPAAEIPYRIYVDHGYILACMTSLAPLCPLLGPFALMYYVILAPMLRWLVVFAYRPRWDGGGDKWPQIHHIIVTSLLLGQIITSISFFLKGNVYEGLVIAFCIFPTLLCNSIILERFLRPFKDSSLLQTGRIYNANKAKDVSISEREEFRRWLVDCHKASYLPTCLSGGKTSLFTAEPALTVPKVGEEVAHSQQWKDLLRRQKTQKGRILRHD